MSSFIKYAKSNEHLNEWYFKYPEKKFINRRLVVETCNDEDILFPSIYAEYDTYYLEFYLKVIDTAINSISIVMLAALDVMTMEDKDFDNIHFTIGKGGRWKNENIHQTNTFKSYESRYGTMLNIPVLKLYRNVYMKPDSHCFSKCIGCYAI